MRFVEYLTEVMVDIDPNDPVAAQQQARLAARQGEQRAAIAQQEKAKAEQIAAKAAGEDQDPDVKRLIMLRQQVAQLEQKIARKQKQAGTQMQ